MAKQYKRSSSKAWLSKGVATETRRPALTSIYNEYGWGIACDGYQMLIDFRPDETINATPGEYTPVHKNSVDRFWCEYNYPNILSVIPRRDNHSYVTVHADKLKDALKLAAVFAKHNANSVRLSYQQGVPGAPGWLRVHGKAPALGEAMTELNAACSLFYQSLYSTFDESALQVSTNYRYLLNALAGMRHAENRLVTLSVQGPDYPVLLWPGEVIHAPSFSPRDAHSAGDRAALIMPMSRP